MQYQNIPNNAKKVHSGPSFDIFQRDQELFDGSHKIYEIARMADSVKVVLVDREHKKIIMIKDEQPDITRVTFAGGLVEQDEDYIQAAYREVAEETGYEYEHIQERFSLPYTHRVSGQTQYYIAWGLSQNLTTNPDHGSEKITILPKTFDEFIDHIIDTNNHSHFSYYMCKHYILPNKIQELRKLLFGEG